MTANPIATEMTVIIPSAIVDPMKLIILPHRIAKSAAMKKVLSPISEAKIKLKAAKNPDFARTELESKWRIESRAGVAAPETTAAYPPAARAAATAPRKRRFLHKLPQIIIISMGNTSSNLSCPLNLPIIDTAKNVPA